VLHPRKGLPEQGGEGFGRWLRCGNGHQSCGGGVLVSCGARVIGTGRSLYRGLGRGVSVSNSDGLHESPYWEGIDRAHLLAVFLRRPVFRLIRETR
jgi:hypothetical protein